jgi:type VII ESX secretion system EccE translocon-like protein
MSSSPDDPWYGRGAADQPTAHGGLARRTRGLLVLGEATVAAVAGGIAVGGALGWTVGVLGVVVAAVALAGGRGGWWSGTAAPPDAPADLVARLRVLGVPSRSTGDVGVISDGQGFAAGVEIDVAKGALLDLQTLAGVVAADRSRPSALQMRLTTYAPPGPGAGFLRRPHAGSVAVHRRLHVLLRLEPTWAGDVVAAHGGGARGSRAALVAAVDRLSARLRRAGVVNRVLDPAALNALLAEDTAPDLATELLAADLGSPADLERLVGVLQQSAPERSIVSLCVDLASSDQWQSYAVVLAGARDAQQLAAVSAVLLADRAISGAAAASALSTVLPLGGGPGDLTSVLTLARV